ncbi:MULTISPECIES: hypothetical protein [Streptomyces]|jgi:hypothetical protein|uniref:hypothetical protein n=1 Tax=Streptomyces TaxID=1883 RepID=UPI000F745BC6|nr:hypothetical protein [Streptomyces sp. WAC05292]RSS92578.1 hypothetical protein EF903_09440 [Streptomyces sp. WAC05292]
MRPSPRVPGVLAGLVLAAGSVLFAAPQASATGVQDCQEYVASHGKPASAAVAQACYEGSIGNQTSCVASLEQAGVTADVAGSACRASR